MIINLEEANGQTPAIEERHNSDEETEFKSGRNRRSGQSKTAHEMLKKSLTANVFEKSGRHTLESFSEKTQMLWTKIKGVVTMRSTVRSLSNIIAQKNLNEKQIELISDFSHGKLDNVKISRFSAYPGEKSRQSTKKSGSGRLKKLLTKYATKKNDVQGDFFLLVMVI